MEIVYYTLVAANLLQTFLLYAIKARQNSPFQFFYLLIGGIVVFPAAFEALNEMVVFHPFAAPVFLSTDAMVRVQLFVLTYLAAFLVLEPVFYRPVRATLWSAAASPGVFLFAPYFIPVMLAVIVALSGLSAVTTATFSDVRSGEFSNLYLAIQYLSIMSVWAPAYYLFCRRNAWAAAAMLALIFGALFMVGGSRQAIVVSTLFAFAVFYRRLGYAPVYMFVLFALGFSGIDAAAGLLKLLRNATGVEERLDVLASVLSGESTDTVVSSEAMVRYFMYQTFEYWPHVYENSLSYLSRTLLFWLPSFADIFAIKPPDFEAELFYRLMGEREGTLHATYFGATFADAGYWFPVWIVLTFGFFRLVEHWCDERHTRYYFVFWGLGVYVAVMSARGSLYAPAVMVFLAGAIIIAERALARFSIISSRSGRVARRSGILFRGL